METTLHRQLKAIYADEEESRQEIAVDGFRIDALAGDLLIEVQSASLFAIRAKVRKLLQRRRVLVVKPLAARTVLAKQSKPGGEIVRRASPRKETFLHLFEDLVHFVDVFPHRRLEIEVLLCELEERREFFGPLPSWRRNYRVADRSLLEARQRVRLATAADLVKLLPADLPREFSTGDLAEVAKVPRSLARKIAYCLRKTNAAHQVGKRGNALIYRFRQVKSVA